MRAVGNSATGVRTGDATEHEYIDKAGIRMVGVDDIESVLDGLTGPVYVHIDLDVIDPAEFGSVCYPEPDGVPSRRLIDLVSRLTTWSARASLSTPRPTALAAPARPR